MADRTRVPTKLANLPATGAPKDWRWGYLTCGCRNDGFGNHIHRSNSRLDEADRYAQDASEMVAEPRDAASTR